MSGVTDQYNSNIKLTLFCCLDLHKKNIIIFKKMQEWHWFLSHFCIWRAISNVTEFGPHLWKNLIFFLFHGESFLIFHDIKHHPGSFMTHGNHAMIIDWSSTYHAMIHGWFMDDAGTVILQWSTWSTFLCCYCNLGPLNHQMWQQNEHKRQ